jgi:hypothetical protein
MILEDELAFEFSLILMHESAGQPEPGAMIRWILIIFAAAPVLIEQHASLCTSVSNRQRGY